MVEELLSRSVHISKETAVSIADAAMLEVAGISMGHMVHSGLVALVVTRRYVVINFPTCYSQEPDEFYEGITFEHFLKVGARCES